MGLNDRDYARQLPREGAGRATPASVASGGDWFAPRSWTMTRWLIVLNVAVFLIGLLLWALPQGRGLTLVPSHTEWRDGVTITQRWNSAVLTQGQSPEQLFQHGAPRVEQSTNRPLGIQHFTYTTHDRAWGHFSTYNVIFRLEIWRFITFQFLHASPEHLILNLLSLWVFGLEVEQYLGKRRYLALYLVCGIFGALLYLGLNLLGNLTNLRVPFLLFDDIFTQLVGASAGIFGIMLAAAFVAPHRMLEVLGIFPVRLKPAVYAFLGIAVINLVFGRNNQGGEAAHIGGAVAGYYFIRHMYLLRDFFDILGNDEHAKPTGTEVDRVLAKISASGRESLTPDELAILERAGRTMRR